ncbi:MAG: tyrosine-type recombinase/integrase [Promethearchaeota archaeon]
MREKLLLRLLLETGARISDQCNWEFSQVHEDDEWFIDYTSQKTNRKVRAVINGDTFNLIQKWKQVKEKDTRKAQDPRILPYTTQHIRRILTKLKYRAGIRRKIRPHDFCRSTITRLGQLGYDAGFTAKQVGRDVITIQRIYQDVTLKDKGKLAKAMSIDSIVKDIND